MNGSDDKLHIVSHFPGRIRVRADKFCQEPGRAEAATRRLSGEPGVTSATSSALTGSILVVYDPHKVQVEGLIAALLEESGLPSIASDGKEHALGTAAATRTRQMFASVDKSLFRAADGKVDLRTAVPGALAIGGVATLLLKQLVAPQWYDLVFWSYVTFNNLNLVGRPARGKPDTDSRETDSRDAGTRDTDSNER